MDHINTQEYPRIPQNIPLYPRIPQNIHLNLQIFYWNMFDLMKDNVFVFFFSFFMDFFFFRQTPGIYQCDQLRNANYA